LRFEKPKGYFDQDREPQSEPDQFLIAEAQVNRLTIERDLQNAIETTFSTRHPGDKLKRLFGIKTPRQRRDDD
jgi:hypothetical protein